MSLPAARAVKCTELQCLAALAGIALVYAAICMSLSPKKESRQDARITALISLSFNNGGTWADSLDVVRDGEVKSQHCTALGCQSPGHQSFSMCSIEACCSSIFTAVSFPHKSITIIVYSLGNTPKQLFAQYSSFVVDVWDQFPPKQLLAQ